MSATVLSGSYEAIAPLNQITAPIIATGEPVHFYDKNAHLLPCDASHEWPVTDDAHVWVRGEIKDTPAGDFEIINMLHHGRVLAMEEEKGLVIQQKDDGHIIFYSVIPSRSPIAKAGSMEDLRQLLKRTFAGWHHAYHEVFASASDFVMKIMGNVTPMAEAR
jgi:hypothetical protein